MTIFGLAESFKTMNRPDLSTICFASNKLLYFIAGVLFPPDSSGRFSTSANSETREFSEYCYRQKIARKPGKIWKEIQVGCTGEGKR